MLRTTSLAAAAVTACIAAGAAGASASATEIIRPGEAIGRIRLGMSLAAVRRALGPPQTVNRRVRLGFGRRYVEYSWDYGWWSVGLQGRAGDLRVVRIGTSSSRERTPAGIGPGSHVRDVVRRYPGAQCRRNHPRGGQWIVLRHGGGRLTAFAVAVGPVTIGPPDVERRDRVLEVIVKAPVREHGVTRIVACPADWRTP